jgi:hypothetical protein
MSTKPISSREPAQELERYTIPTQAPPAGALLADVVTQLLAERGENVRKTVTFAKEALPTWGEPAQNTPTVMQKYDAGLDELALGTSIRKVRLAIRNMADIAFDPSSEHVGPWNSWHPSFLVHSYHQMDLLALRERFERLAAQWRTETLMEPQLNRRAMHWSYQQIIGMGPPALPLILAELRSEVDDWFWALIAIAGMDVAEGRETMSGAAEAWLDWGRREGYVE